MDYNSTYSDLLQTQSFCTIVLFLMVISTIYFHQLTLMILIIKAIMNFITLSRLL